MSAEQTVVLRLCEFHSGFFDPTRMVRPGDLMPFLKTSCCNFEIVAASVAQPATVDAAKSRFLEVCAGWADLLIEDAKRVKLRDGEQRWSFDPESMIPNVELPDAQRKVWIAAWQLMSDAWDAHHAAGSEPGPKADG